jgi:hypothetical protein
MGDEATATGLAARRFRPDLIETAQRFMADIVARLLSVRPPSGPGLN